MLNTRKHMSTALLAIAVIFANGCAATSKKEGTGEYIDDTVITTKVKAAIFNDKALKSAEINVETFKGIVQLSGFVTSVPLANRAIEVTRKVEGVKSIKNDMQIK